MKKAFLIICLMCALNIVYSQESTRKVVDYKAGLGVSVFDWEGLLSFENEINFKLSNYFSTSAYFGLGSSLATTVDVSGYNHQIHNVVDLRTLYDGHITDYLQIGINVFVSPFKNDKRNNFKIGLGVGLGLLKETNIYDIYVSTGTVGYYDKFMRVAEETRETRLLINFIIEDEYWINSRFSIGGKLYGTAINGLIVGGMVKLGIAL